MAQWSSEGLEEALRDKDWLVRVREIDYGIQFDLKEGTKVNLYNTGKVSFGGPSSPFKSEVEEFVRTAASVGVPSRESTRIEEQAADPSSGRDHRVFVVYGHDTAARNELELILRRVQVTPIILQNIPGVGETLIEKLESLTDADFACVLLTPDDVGASAVTPDNLQPRARQNVVLEMGMVLSRLGRHRVAILVKGNQLEKPSDIDGLIYIGFQEEVGEAATALGAALASAGFNIDIRDLLGT